MSETVEQNPRCPLHVGIRMVELVGPILIRMPSGVLRKVHRAIYRCPVQIGTRQCSRVAEKLNGIIDMGPAKEDGRKQGVGSNRKTKWASNAWGVRA